MVLLNPKMYEKDHADTRSKEIMLKTIDFFEKKGLKKLKEDDGTAVWYDDYLNFIKENEIFADLLTPTGYAPEARWDLWRISEFNEVSGFYGLAYQYCYQVTILGLGPIFLGSNEELKKKAAQKLREGGVFAFALSEREHGNDIYSDEMTLYPNGDGTYLAKGNKYYIGNGNKACMVSVFGKLADTGEYVFFVVDSQHPNFELVKKIDTSGARQAYVSEFNLNDYPITEADFLSRGQKAWDDALCTVNIGKFQVGWETVGESTHALYEALHHTCHRTLYGKPVYAFDHVRRLFIESYVRLMAMKLYALRAIDYFRSASDDDRRYLMYNAILKMKVTGQAAVVADALLDIVAAKGFEQETFFEMYIRDVTMPPRLEGTTHVNMALINKFMFTYFFDNIEMADTPRRSDAADDKYVFNQKAGGLAKVRFGDWKKPYVGIELANVKKFRSQVDLLVEFLSQATPSDEQKKNVDFMIAVGELVTMAAYAQLILENVKIYGIDDDVVEEIFSCLIRDFSRYALMVNSTFTATSAQETLLEKMILVKPVLNKERADRLWTKVLSMCDDYVMND
ncbi:MAG: acyl-CoA dehydrogenase [Methylocystaceae bacterium]